MQPITIIKTDTATFGRIIQEDTMLIDSNLRIVHDEIFIIQSRVSNDYVHCTAKEIIEVQRFFFSKKTYLIRFSLTGMINIGGNLMPISDKENTDIYGKQGEIIDLKDTPRIHEVDNQGSIIKSYKLKSFNPSESPFIKIESNGRIKTFIY
jgi:hypothetical protein